MYLINSMKSYSIENIRIQDILLISICILLFLNRAVPIDYSSIWRVTVLCLIYTCIRIMPKRQCYCLLYIVCIWGITEVIISTLQKVNYLESNHHDFGITGTFGNPGPLGGLLAVCWIVSIFFIYENIQNKHRILTLSFCMIACFILYGLLVKKKTYNQSQTNSFEIRFSAYHHRFYHINLLYKKRFGRWTVANMV